MIIYSQRSKRVAEATLCWMLLGYVNFIICVLYIHGYLINVVTIKRLKNQKKEGQYSTISYSRMVGCTICVPSREKYCYLSVICLTTSNIRLIFTLYSVQPSFCCKNCTKRWLGWTKRSGSNIEQKTHLELGTVLFLNESLELVRMKRVYRT